MIWEALVLGVIQGLTEFLPVSSSAHLTILPQMLHWETPWLNSLSFDVALHLGTFLALLFYFWKDIRDLTGAWLKHGWTRNAFEDPNAKLAWLIGLATLPGVVAGVLFEKKMELLFRSPQSVAISLIAAGLLLGVAEYFSGKTGKMDSLGWGRALVIGIAQVLALIPGVSRSGITITAGLAAGLDRETSARFSFLLALPIIGGACVFKVKDFLEVHSGLEMTATALGVLAAGLAGWLCIRFLLVFLRTRSLYVFVAYRIILGVGILGWLVLK